MNEYVIREVRKEDAGRLAEIYAYYVQNTAISFEYEAPSTHPVGLDADAMPALFPDEAQPPRCC